MLTNSDLVELTAFRRDLHRHPEVSGEEVETARRIVEALEVLKPTKVITGIGGSGVAAVFDSGVAGPTVLFRAELDALPIEELSQATWVSTVPGKSHVCGHDGHMTILMALGRMIGRLPVAKGRVVLMFQPAEENGSGARAVVSDPKFAEIAPDWAFAIHNFPGVAFGKVATQAGLMNCASQGLAIRLVGKTAHASSPEDGTSPALAVAQLVPEISQLGVGGALDETFRLVTVTHLRVGEATFGVAPGEAVVHATLRATQDAAIAEMAAEARAMATRIASAHGLAVGFEVCDDFAASINDGAAVAVAKAAMEAIKVPLVSEGLPMRGSEDFGVFGWGAKAAMLLLGAGEGFAALHNPDYDFDDDLIPVGAAIFERIARDLLG